MISPNSKYRISGKKVVCKNCSSYKAKLEYENYKLKRVCKDCYYVLDDSATIITQPVLTQGPTHRRRGVLNVKASDPALLSGYLHMTQDKKNWQKRYFAIHSDFVLYSFKARQDVRALTSMPLPGYIAEDTTSKDEIDREHVFKISRQTSQSGGMKTYYFQCDDKSLKNRWLEVLGYVVNAELPPETINIRADRSHSVA